MVRRPNRHIAKGGLLGEQAVWGLRIPKGKHPPQGLRLSVKNGGALDGARDGPARGPTTDPREAREADEHHRPCRRLGNGGAWPVHESVAEAEATCLGRGVRVVKGICELDGLASRKRSEVEHMGFEKRFGASCSRNCSYG